MLHGNLTVKLLNKKGVNMWQYQKTDGYADRQAAAKRAKQRTKNRK